MADLEALVPKSWSDLGAGTFHGLPYSYCRLWNVERKGVFCATRGFIFGKELASQYSVIRAINGKDVDTLEDFVKAMRAIKHGEYFLVRFNVQNLFERTTRESRVMMERQMCSGISLWELQPKQ